MAPSGFGPRVIGEEEFADEEEEREESRHVFGERVVGEKASQATLDEGADTAEEEDTRTASEKLADELPPGYTFEKSGGYYALYDPDDELVDSGTESGKHQGAEATLEAALADQAEREQEGKADGEQEDAATQEWGEEKARQASLDELEEALEANPSLVNTFMRAEIQREDGVRERAIDLLEQAEIARAEADGDDPRDEVMSTLNSLRADIEE